MTQRPLLVVPAALMLLVLAACGDNGGDDANLPVPVPPADIPNQPAGPSAPDAAPAPPAAPAAPAEDPLLSEMESNVQDPVPPADVPSGPAPGPAAPAAPPAEPAALAGQPSPAAASPPAPAEAPVEPPAAPAAPPEPSANQSVFLERIVGVWDYDPNACSGESMRIETDRITTLAQDCTILSSADVDGAIALGLSCRISNGPPAERSWTIGLAADDAIRIVQGGSTQVLYRCTQIFDDE